MSGTIKGLEAYPQRTDGWVDHVHILCGMRAKHCVSDVVREIKKASSVWVKQKVGPPKLMNPSFTRKEKASRNVGFSGAFVGSDLSVTDRK